MNLKDILLPPPKIKTEKWQLGSMISHEISEAGIVLFFVSDFRGVGTSSENQDFTPIRKYFYQLSKLDFEIPIADLGDLISGKTLKDSHYAVEEIVSACLYKNAIPIIVGGSNDFAHPLFSTLNFHQKNNNYTQISNVVSLNNDGDEISEKNYLSKIFTAKNFSIKNFHLLGYQKHLNETDSVKLIKEVKFDIVRLAEMMGNTEKMEPFFRNADLVTLNCDAVESLGDAFSVNPQINGLNRREICMYMKEIGLGEKLKAAGIFNYNIKSKNILNQQLIAQMLWYLVEGINIQKSHPKQRNYETFFVLIDDNEYAFKRDTFSGLWYFGKDENIENCTPCSREDYENAKRGMLNLRFLCESRVEKA
ncbi:MAG: arginase [Flavobacteriaceae bacterium]|jgi:hypothetical protein|nr:arginase [Flavobacteriaceae bacterium]